MFSGGSRFIVFLIVTNIFTDRVIGEYTCQDFVDRPHANITISDTFVGVIESSFISDLEDAEIINSAYLEAYMDLEGYLTIEATKSFKKYKSDDHIISILQLECTDSKYELEYHVNIERNFCDSITFDREQYYYQFFDGLPPDYNFDLSDSEEMLVVCAEDSVEFAIEENQYFAIEATGSEEDGQYYATLRVLNEIRAPFRGSFNISAWDIKNPEKVAASIVTVEIVNEDFPIFTQTAYYGEVTEDLKVVILNGPIALDTDDIDGFNVIVEEDYQYFFDVEFSTNEVKVFLLPELTLETLPKFPLRLTLIVYNSYLGDVDETTVTLDGPTFPDTAEEYETNTPPDGASASTESVVNDILSSTQAASTYASEEDVVLVTTEIVTGDKNDDVSTEKQPDDEDDVRNVEDKELTTAQWDFEDKSEEDELEEEYEKLNDRVHLAGFEFWATNMKAFIIALAMLSVVLILSAIIYIKNKTNAYRRYNPAYYN